MPNVTDTTWVTELFDPKEVNKHLNKGWTLLAINPNNLANAEHPNVYVLGETSLAADMKDITSVTEVHTDGALRDKIDEGWVLLNVLQNTDETFRDLYSVLYVMGKPISRSVQDC